MSFEEKNLRPNSLRPMGDPLPYPDRHAVSVSLPTWRDVVDYEEGNRRVHDAMKSGYPRFRLHQSVNELCTRYKDPASGETPWVFPSRRVAEACVRYVGAGRIQNTADGLALVYVPHNQNAKAKQFWQHTGLLVSSRRAEDILNGKPPASPASLEPLKRLVAAPYGANAEDVYLFPTGIAALFKAHQAVICARGVKTLQVGFPYLDALKIQQKFGEGIYCPYNKPEDLDAVERLVKQGHAAAVFCEVPGNPLLRTIDLQRLSSFLKKHNVPLIIDDTLGTPYDIDIRPYADVIITSLTKFFSGKGNVAGGSLILNPQSPHYHKLKTQLDRGEELLYGADADILLENGRGFAARMQVINSNAEKLADYLRAHPAIDQVFYPKGDAAYEALRRPGGGYGGLLSFTLKDKSATPLVYNRLPFAKGPSLGTEFTLFPPIP